MPNISVWMIRLSLLYLAVAAVTGSVLLLNKTFMWTSTLWMLLPVHLETALFGWALQFVMGTAYWIFPRHLTKPGRGNQWMARSMAVSLNCGIVIPLLLPGYEWMKPAGRVLIVVSIVLFIALMWGRTVKYRSR